MIVPVWNKDNFVAEYVSQFIPEISGARDWGPFRAVGFCRSHNLVTEGKPLIAGVIFNNARYNKNGGLVEVELSVAAGSPAWCNRRVLRTVFELVFNQWGSVRAVASVRKKNRKARKWVERLGFQEEGNKRRGYFGKDDLIIYGMLRNECRWIK